MAENFQLNRPAIRLEDLSAFALIWTNPVALLPGLPFSLCVMGILLAHELGHYLACVYYRVDASLPYFIPAPTFIGTFGAFIRIRTPIFSKQVLFDVGIAGPLAGFLALLPVLSIGLAYSKIIPGIANTGDIVFGTPLIMRLLERVILPGVPASDIYLHPVARAAWVGIFSTALNLLPIGQLDGGHILYSFAGERHKLMSKILTGALVPFGVFFWQGWLVWALLLLIFGMRHPSVYDPRPIGADRIKLGSLALLVFLLSFTVEPFLGEALLTGWR
ncbi:MAG: site-2 protease family protein [Acidobacteria bacterium]|nr:site-2 protease family protein [Acidobacteriota bacterium]